MHIHPLNLGLFGVACFLSGVSWEQFRRSKLEFLQNLQEDLQSSSDSSSPFHNPHCFAPLPACVQYSHRPAPKFQNSKLSHAGTTVDLVYISEGKAGQKATSFGLHGISQFQSGFEASVANAFMAILSFSNKDWVVLDGGMNMGLYTTLTALMGFEIHSLDIQFDCFDVASNLLFKNHRNRSQVHFHHLGLWHNTSMATDILEGCDPGRNLGGFRSQADAHLEAKGNWTRRSHTVPLVTLDDFIDSTLAPQRQVALLKLDVEGAETAILQGLTTNNLQRIHNIVMECAVRFQERMGFHGEQLKAQLRKLQQAHFTPYMLFNANIGPATNPTKLSRSGLEWVQRHPLTGESIETGHGMLWKVLDWDLLLDGKGFCSRGCNVWFTKTPPLQRNVPTQQQQR